MTTVAQLTEHGRIPWDLTSPHLMQHLTMSQPVSTAAAGPRTSSPAPWALVLQSS